MLLMLTMTDPQTVRLRSYLIQATTNALTLTSCPIVRGAGAVGLNLKVASQVFLVSQRLLSSIKVAGKIDCSMGAQMDPWVCSCSLLVWLLRNRADHSNFSDH